MFPCKYKNLFLLKKKKKHFICIEKYLYSLYIHFHKVNRMFLFLCTAENTYNLYLKVYDILYLDYKFILSLFSSQVSIKRSFSTFKYILNRSKNCLSQSNLEAFVLMSCEKDVVAQFNNNEIISNLVIINKH